MKQPKIMGNHTGLYRARLSCKIGKDAIDGNIPPPHGTHAIDYAMFNLLSAVEEIAVYLDEKEGAK